MRADQGTDAPKFFILNVVPGSPDADFFGWQTKKVEAPKTRIKGIVEEMKADNARRGQPDPKPLMQEL